MEDVQLSQQDKFMLTRDMWRQARDKETELRAKAVNAAIENGLTHFNFSKQDLNPDPDHPIHFRPDDQIEVRLSKGEDGNPKWEIRNKSIAKANKYPPPEGEATNGIADDILQLADIADPRKININTLKTAARDVDETGKEVEVYVFKQDGTVLGMATIGQAGVITTLATNPDNQHQGIAQAILNQIKKDRSFLRITATPFGIDKSERSIADAKRRLEDFYTSQGFTGPENTWEENQININDVNTAGEWQAFDRDQRFQVGIGQHIDDMNTIVRNVLTHIAENSRDREMQNETVFLDWKNARDEEQRLFKEKEHYQSQN